MNDEPYVEELRLLLAHGEPLAPKAAKLRPLLPRIIQRLAAGAPRKVIVEQLNRAGLDLSLHDLAKQLQKYRKAQRAVISHSPHSPNSPYPPHPPRASTLANSASTFVPATAQASVRGQPNRIENPADLRKIRSMEVDLDALRREGQAMRRDAINAKNFSNVRNVKNVGSGTSPADPTDSPPLFQSQPKLQP
jgi:hypothetical protein